jgi:hypothetical protein
VSPWALPDTRPRASVEQIRRFLDSYGATEFRHAGELVPLMQRDDPDETRITRREYRVDAGLRSIYQRRAMRNPSAPPSPFFPPGLADDLRDLSSQLDAARDQPLCFWDIDLPSGTTYIVFELLDDRRIAGCVKTADQRVVDPHPF